VSVLPDESARLRKDATLPCPDVHGTELHGAGVVEETSVARLQDGQAGPSQCRVQGEGPRPPQVPTLAPVAAELAVTVEEQLAWRERWLASL
jgi:hypothetical protein